MESTDKGVKEANYCFFFGECVSSIHKARDVCQFCSGGAGGVTTTPKGLLTSVVGVGMGESGWGATVGKWEWLGDEEERIAER